MNYAIDCANGTLGPNPLESTTTSTTSIAEGDPSTTNGQPNQLVSTLMLLIPLALIIIFWVFSSRSQKKKEKEQQEQRNAIKPGDTVITIGGIVGKVVSAKPGDEKITIEVGGERNRIVIMKWAIQTITTAAEQAAVEKATAVEKTDSSKAPKQKD